jgi:hypothetical protein
LFVSVDRLAEPGGIMDEDRRQCSLLGLFAYQCHFSYRR